MGKPCGPALCPWKWSWPTLWSGPGSEAALCVIGARAIRSLLANLRARLLCLRLENGHPLWIEHGSADRHFVLQHIGHGRRQRNLDRIRSMVDQEDNHTVLRCAAARRIAASIDRKGVALEPARNRTSFIQLHDDHPEWPFSFFESKLCNFLVEQGRAGRRRDLLPRLRRDRYLTHREGSSSYRAAQGAGLANAD